MDNAAETLLNSDLALIYGDENASAVATLIAGLLARWQGVIPERSGGWSERDSFLITYGDSIQDGGEGDSLDVLRQFLAKYVRDRISLVHVLPFYPSTSDDGFSVVDFREIDPAVGNWEDMKNFAGEYRMVFDGVVNHVSKSSAYVRGHLAGEPKHADFCIEETADFDASQVTRPRTSPLFHAYEGKNGEVKLWTTFSEDQVDLNFSNPAVLIELLDVLLFYAQKGASMIRLDAIPYMWKESGTNCVHRPQTHAFIRVARAVLDAVAPHVLLLSETNVPHAENLTYFGDKGDEAQMIYNFTLSPLIIYAFTTGDASPLTGWAKSLESPGEKCTFLNVSATHDGIGMRPTEGILDEDQRQVLLNLTKAHGGSVAARSNPDGTESPYELNITFFDAINNPNDPELRSAEQRARFLAAQSITMCLMGIPGIYIHSLLGSRNDYAGRDSSGIPRRINREKLDLEKLVNEIDDAGSLRNLVFEGMLHLLSIRKEQSAFHPAASQIVLELDDRVFAVLRECGRTGQRILALCNVSAEALSCDLGEIERPEKWRDLINEETLKGETSIPLGAWQVRWLT